ncbi:MAG: hypothetical protein JL50_17035 [Peptococcaceae bacterium BICA1-7]|nr:MAG: hypothetical protein JL50_17035 [Peptococcaceae bacterium BICA1-7]HBV96501.1 PHP domain-containing protein [Desulfotomaculum sp.]
MIVDLHVHTSALSACSCLDPEDAVKRAKEIGLEGICFTEHCRLWPVSDLERLSQKYELPVFGGMEVETREGHMLVFGLSTEIKELITAAELRDLVDREGGAIIYAHPFRGFLMFSFGDLRLTVDEACGRPVFETVNAVEALSGKSTRGENDLALEVLKRLKIPGTGGSDAHSAGEVGRCVTIFKKRIDNIQDLVTCLKRGECRAAYRGK